MAGEITQTELQNAKLDAITLAQAVTTNATITPRTGSAFSSIPKLVADKGADLDAETANAANWAAFTGGTVPSSSPAEYSAKSYAQEDLTGSAGGSAKDWAITAEDTVVASGEYSAKHYAAKAEAALADFNNRFLGEFANDTAAETAAGAELGAGDFYFNTSDNNLHFYTGVEWKTSVLASPAVNIDVTGATVGQALGYPNNASTLEPYTPAGGGDLLAAANETVTGNWSVSGDWSFSGGFDLSGLSSSVAASALFDLGVQYVKHVAAGEDIQAAIDAIGALGGGIVQLGQGQHDITSTIKIGDGSAGSASSYNNVMLRGCGAAPLASTTSGTEIRWTGTTSSSNVMVEVAGRSSGMGIEGVYLNANDAAGDCLVIKSNIYGCFRNILGQGYLRYGCHLTIQETPPNAVWYATTNVFERCAFFEGSNLNTQAWRLAGTNDNGFLNDPHRCTFISCQGSSARSLDTGHEPCALYLGYADSLTFIECDFQLDSITEDAVLDDRQALKDANGASYTDGDNIKLRYYGTVPGDAAPNNIRYEVYYQYDASSTATNDDDSVIEPADSNGRFLRYQGAAVALDATVRDNFPQNIFFNNCALIKNPSFEDWTSNANTPGNAATNTPSVCLIAQALADAEEVPMYIPRAVGITDGMKVFNALNDDALARGDAIEVGCEQDNQSRKFYMRLNADSDTGGGASGNFGGFLAVAERASDTASYSTVGRVNMSRVGDWSPNAANQDLGLSGTPWDVAYINTVEATDVNFDQATISELSSAPSSPVEGMVAYASGVSWDPLNANAGEAVPYITQYRDSAWRDIQPGLRVYSLTIADDAATSFTPPGSAGFLEAQLTISSSRYGHARWSVGAGAQMVDITSGANMTFTTGVLSGTTGTDGHVTISTHTDGDVYVENRSGAVNTTTIWLRYNPD